MSKVSCGAVRKHRRCLCEWRGLNCYYNKGKISLYGKKAAIAAFFLIFLLDSQKQISSPSYAVTIPSFSILVDNFSCPVCNVFAI